MNGKFLTTITEVRIGNNGQPNFYITGKNEAIVKQALKEFTDKMFDTPCVHYYVKIDQTDCILDSVELAGCVIWASLRYYTIEKDSEDDKSLEESLFEESLRRGALFLGCEYEFDSGEYVSPQYLGLPNEDMERMCISDQLNFIKFHMLYYYSYPTSLNISGYRKTIYRIPEFKS